MCSRRGSKRVSTSSRRLVPARTASRRYDMAIQLFSAMVGALILARAVDEEALSRRILQTVAEGLKRVAPS